MFRQFRLLAQTFVSPLEWFCHRLVKVINERLDPLLEVIDRGKTATLEQSTYQNTKPNFNLI